MCDGIERRRARVVPRGDDNLGIGLEAQDLVERRQPLAGALRIAGQAQIERDHRGLLGAQGGDGAGAVSGDGDLEIGIGPAQLGLQTGVVLHHQQAWFGEAGHAVARPEVKGAATAATRGRRMIKRVPTPSRDSTSSRPPMPRTRSRAS